ncbi:MAG: serine/threonine protein kinase [Porticoccaceae bacterium]
MTEAAHPEAAHPFEILTPEFLLSAVESQGFVCDGRLYPLNSYENRVYQVGIEDAEPLIAKFYRPERWTDAQIAEEHAFCFELAELELPVVTPLRVASGESLLQFGGFRFALFPRRGGRAPELDNPDTLVTLGRMLGRIHGVGASRPFQHRPILSVDSHGRDSVALISAQFMPPSLKPAYDSVARDLLARVDDVLGEIGNLTLIRTHGDCHVGNLLWRDDAPNFVDFDDARMAPAMQDLWMLLSGGRMMQTAQMEEIVEGYNEFHDFSPRELRLIEPLRSLRILHYSAWLARRVDDPAFVRAFPWFNTERYWGEHILALREQMSALTEPPLQLR